MDITLSLRNIPDHVAADAVRELAGIAARITGSGWEASLDASPSITQE
jgi:hypothetical protein